MIILATLLTGVLAIFTYFVVICERRFSPGPLTFFVVVNGGSLISTATFIDSSQPFATSYLGFMAAGLAALVAGAWIVNRLTGFSHRAEVDALQLRSWPGVTLPQASVIVLMALGSVVVIIAYFRAIGYFVPWEALKLYLRFQDIGQAGVLYSTLRYAAHRGEYSAPGYAMQFTDALLPVICAFAYFWTKERVSGWRRMVWLLLLLIAVAGLIGTGRRTGLVIFLGAFISIGMWRGFGTYGIRGRERVIIGAAVLVLFAGLTALMGRGMTGNLAEKLLLGPIFLFNRLFVSQAHEHALVFQRALYHAPPSLGYDWWTALRGALPGTAPTAANEYFLLVYGTPQGNLGLDAWSSMWQNFRWTGVLMFGLWGALLQLYYIRIIRGRKDLFRIVTLLYAGVLLGIAEEPFALLLHGFVAIQLLRFCVWVAEELYVRPVRKPSAETPIPASA